jgi:hypothetical protein
VPGRTAPPRRTKITSSFNRSACWHHARESGTTAVAATVAAEGKSAGLSLEKGNSTIQELSGEQSEKRPSTAIGKNWDGCFQSGSNSL